MLDTNPYIQCTMYYYIYFIELLKICLAYKIFVTFKNKLFCAFKFVMET